MNTCAECRFWKDVDPRRFIGAIAVTSPSGEFKECGRVREMFNGAFIIAFESDQQALMTRSDFGCVQFERLDLACASFSESETDPRSCKHCGWSDEMHLAESTHRSGK